jgi:hypothetical protein
MAQMQTGPCAFSNACVTPGPRVRIEGTNRSCCAPHAALLQITVATGLGAVPLRLTEVQLEAAFARLPSDLKCVALAAALEA